MFKKLCFEVVNFKSIRKLGCESLVINIILKFWNINWFVCNCFLDYELNEIRIMNIGFLL